jgi:CheY-like chemotaxis protein
MTNTGKKTILLADGNATARKVLAVRLQYLDHEIAEAGTVEEMDQMISGKTFDLIIVDARLTGPAGDAVLQKVQSKKTPVFLLTDRFPEGGDLEGQFPVKAVFHRSQRTEMLARIESCFSDPAESKSAVRPKEYQVLLIEDSPTIRGFLKRVVVKNFPGSTVREAEDGRQAMNEMSSKRVDFIVTDLQMPGMDGQTFLNILHRNPVLKNKPVLVLSGSFTPQLREELKAYPTVRTLAKPSSDEEIASTLKELIAVAEALPRLTAGE